MRKFDQETCKIFREEIMPTMGVVETRPRKTESELADLLTVKGALKWEGWRPFDVLKKPVREQVGEYPLSNPEAIETAAYCVMQGAYMAATAYAGASLVQVAVEYLRNM